MRDSCQVPECMREAYSRGYCEMHYRRVLRTGESGPAGPVRLRRTCKAEDCDEPVDAKELCHGHYQRLLRRGQVDLAPLRKGKKMCSVEGCARKAERRGYCQPHYKRVLKYGHPQADIPIREVDGTGHLSHGYMHVNVPSELRYLSDGKTKIAEHRFVMAKNLGRGLRRDENVHHINGDRTDNRLENLELWSRSQPAGKRVEDLLEYAQVILDWYEDELDLISGTN